MNLKDLSELNFNIGFIQGVGEALSFTGVDAAQAGKDIRDAADKILSIVSKIPLDQSIVDLHPGKTFNSQKTQLIPFVEKEIKTKEKAEQIATELIMETTPEFSKCENFSCPTPEKGYLVSNMVVTKRGRFCSVHCDKMLYARLYAREHSRPKTGRRRGVRVPTTPKERDNGELSPSMAYCQYTGCPHRGVAFSKDDMVTYMEGKHAMYFDTEMCKDLFREGEK